MCIERRGVADSHKRNIRRFPSWKTGSLSSADTETGSSSSARSSAVVSSEHGFRHSLNIEVYAMSL